MTDRKTILLCDDELHILRAAEFKFQKAGFQVLCAADGEEGWDLMQEKLPDIVVTDLQMPRLDGIGLAERILQYAPDRTHSRGHGYGQRV